MYGNEDAIGVALNAIFKEGFKRENLFITTKLNTDDHAQQDVEPALRASLERLQLGGWMSHRMCCLAHMQAPRLQQFDELGVSSCVELT